MTESSKRISAAIAFIACVAVTPASFGTPTSWASEASPPLLTAGIFRIESERSYKLSLQLALRIMDAQTRKEQERSLLAVERMRQELAALGGKSGKTARALASANIALDNQISGLRNLTSANAGALYDVNEGLLNKLNFLSFALESETSDTGSRIVGLALRQASLAQRMAKIVLLRSLDKSAASRQGLQVDLAQSRNEFANGLKLLRVETTSNRFLNDRVDLAHQQWLFYEAALTSGAADVSSLRDISTTSDRIAELMIEIVRLGYDLPPDTALTARR